MKIPKHIKQKMHRLARIHQDADRIALELTMYFDGQGFDTDDIWEAKGLCLEELECGNDITEELCRSLEAEAEREMVRPA
jgi:hypothetical protein